MGAPNAPAPSEYDCADVVQEEVLLSYFDKIASPASQSNDGTAAIAITSDDLRDFREKMAEATMGRVFSAAEARQMLQQVDTNSDGVVTAAEFVTYECAALQNSQSSSSVGTGGTCEWVGDGICDEPVLCATGTDTADCENDEQVLPCEYTSDGVCDEGTYCAFGTDTVDCAPEVDACADVTCEAASDDCHIQGTCAGGSCSAETNVEDGTSCDDGNAATTGDVCSSGVCAGTQGRRNHEIMVSWLIGFFLWLTYNVLVGSSG